jgi:lipopolysaccharide transport system ATP-binding protein
MPPAISTRNLGKRYRVNHAVERAPYRTLRDSLARAATAPLRRLRREATSASEEFWACKDVEFDVQPGEVVGIIGGNGAGKSTLLKILSRITSPTAGEVEINGRVGSLLEVGTGFHPELTGRENIFMNGSIIGMSGSEIRRRFDDIVTFAGIERFLDVPVKRYSSGMHVRLGFSVAAHLQPDVLLIDEVLAVGDVSFQQRCRSKLANVGHGGAAVVVVSHDLAMVSRLAARCILIEAGRIMADDDTATVVAAHLSSFRPAAQTGPFADSCGPVAIYAACVRVECGNRNGPVNIDKPFTIDIDYEIRESLRACRIGIIVQRDIGEVILSSFDVDGTDGKRCSRQPGRYHAFCTMPPWLLNAGCYTVSLIADIPEDRLLSLHEHALSFTVERTASRSGFSEDRRPGLVVPMCGWNTERLSE